jgi:hypothetical protein
MLGTLEEFVGLENKLLLLVEKAPKLEVCVAAIDPNICQGEKPQNARKREKRKMQLV